MKTLIVLCALFIVPLNAVATSYYVNNTNGSASDSNAGTNPSLPWLTIGKCASTMSNGDSCTVYAGTYNESPTFSAGGVGAYKTVQVNGTDVVTVHSFTLGSHTKLIGNCPSAPSAIGTCGFSITDPSSPGTTCVSAGSSTDVYVTNNTMTECGGITMSSSASFIYVQGNTVSWLCRTPGSGTACDGIKVHGNHILVEQNDISHYRLGVNYQGTYGVFRNNTFHDQYETDSGQHTDAFFSEPVTEPSQYHVIEGNTHNNAVGPNAKGMLSQGDACSGNCYNVLIRYNTEEHIDSGIIVDENAGSSTNPGFYNVKAYNNTLVDTNRVGSSGSAIDNNYACHSINPADLNNIYYWPGASTVLNAYAADSVCGNTVSSTFNYGHDLAYCNVSSSSSCAIKGLRYNGGSFQSDPGNVFGFAGQTPTNNPNFVNYSANNFNLTAGSPAIGAGTNLTTVSGSDTGSGTSLIVADAAYFQDGYGLIGVQGDWIRIGPTSTVQITSVNYSTNTLTLASPVSRAHGDPIYLYKKSDGVQVLFGSLPDIGAFPFTASGAAPVVSIIIQ